MKLFEAIQSQIAQTSPLFYPELIIAGEKFLYADSHPSPSAISKDFKQLMYVPGLDRDDFEPFGHGLNTLAFGNNDVVLKISSGGLDFVGSGESIKTKDIPPDVAAKVIREGICNGLEYLVCERLNTKEKAALEEIIPYLFHARDKGVIYWDPKPSNFGYNKAGDLRVLDHEHFRMLGTKKDDFEASVAEATQDALQENSQLKFPLLTFDDTHTYIVFHPSALKQLNWPDWQKRISAVLDVVGIGKEEVEMVGGGQVMRIAGTEVTYGTPPHSEELADYLDKNLNRIQSDLRIESFLQKLSEVAGDRIQVNASMLAAMDHKAFLNFYTTMMQVMEYSSGTTKEQVAVAEAAFNDYCKEAYPSRAFGSSHALSLRQ